MVAAGGDAPPSWQLGRVLRHKPKKLDNFRGKSLNLRCDLIKYRILWIGDKIINVLQEAITLYRVYLLRLI